MAPRPCTRPGERPSSRARAHPRRRPSLRATAQSRSGKSRARPRGKRRLRACSQHAACRREAPPPRVVSVMERLSPSQISHIFPSHDSARRRRRNLYHRVHTQGLHSESDVILFSSTLCTKHKSIQPKNKQQHTHETTHDISQETIHKEIKNTKGRRSHIASHQRLKVSYLGGKSNRRRRSQLSCVNSVVNALR
jgi:hypothetical protein